MNNKSLPSAQNKEDHETPNLTDFISKMPDDVLVTILSRLPVKQAVVTSSLSTRWRFLWRNLIRLNFDGDETLYKMAEGEELSDLEVNKFINQVYEVLISYNHPRVQDFSVRFDLNRSCSEDIDEWIRFAFDNKVENLDVDLLDKSYDTRDPDENYDFVSPLPFALVEGMLSLKTLSLKGVNVSKPTLLGILKYSPHLEILYMFGVDLFPHIRVSGHDINLKHFTLVACSGCESISLYGFDLVSFKYSGTEIELHLTDLPKLKELDIGEVSVGVADNVFSQISSCVVYLQVLMLNIYDPKEGLNVNAIPKLPNVKKLKLGMPAEEDDSLLEFTSIAQACPRLETFLISLHWCSPKKSRREVKHVAAPHVHQHLKLLEILGYYGRISDLELAVYVIDNAPALKKMVIDTTCDGYGGDLTKQDVLKMVRSARSTAKHQLTPILPPGVGLAIL